MTNFYGQSVIGLKHLELKQKNQDSFLVKNKRNYSVGIVCDGLGSKKYSKFGSRLLCKLISRNARYVNNKNFNILDFIQKITKKWIKKTKFLGSSNCDSTCLFALANKNICYLCQLGDGTVSCIADDKLYILQNKEDDFINETVSIYKSKLNKWIIKKIDIKEKKLSHILMTTDGISNDLIENTLDLFIKEICDIVCINKKYKNNRKLKEIITSLPNINNKDDKTIVIGRIYGN